MLFKLPFSVSSLLKRVLTFLSDARVLAAIFGLCLFFGYSKYVQLDRDFEKAQENWAVKESQFQQALELERKQVNIVIRRKEKQDEFLIEQNKRDKTEDEVKWDSTPLPPDVINDLDGLYNRYPTGTYGTRGALADMRSPTETGD